MCKSNPEAAIDRVKQIQVKKYKIIRSSMLIDCYIFFRIGSFS